MGADLVKYLLNCTSVPASFWERIRFIVESGESQKYADVASFDPR